MDSGATIVGLVIALLCISPFIIMTINSKRKEKSLLQSLSLIAKDHNAKIAEKDFWGTSAIGLSEDGKYVFAIRNVNNNSKAYMANLLEMQKCRTLNTSKSSKNNGSNVPDRLEIAITNRDKHKPETIFEFYNFEYDSETLSGEIQLMEKWCKAINDKITLLQTKK